MRMDSESEGIKINGRVKNCGLLGVIINSLKNENGVSKSEDKESFIPLRYGHGGSMS